MGVVLQVATRARIAAHTALWQMAFRHVGPHSRVVPPFRGSGLHLVSLGESVYVGTGSWIRAHAPGDEPIIVVGDRVRTGGQTTLSAVVGIRIGNSVTMARNVYIADHTHSYSRTDRPVRDQGLKDERPIVIEDGCWLGSGVVIGPGVTIGEGSVIGAYAVVRSNVPPRSLAVGNPARVVRSWGDAAPG